MKLMFIRYCLTGGIATVAHYTVLKTLADECGIAPALATAVGATVGALIAYAGNKYFTFSSDALHHFALPKFLTIAALGAAANSALVWSGTHWFSVNYWVPQIIATALVLTMTYFFNRSWTFA